MISDPWFTAFSVMAGVIFVVSLYFIYRSLQEIRRDTDE